MRMMITAGFALAIAATPVHAEGDAAKGEQVFKKCMACHAIADKANKVGPSLLGVVGRPVATAEGYKYSDSMKELAAKGAAWDEASLDNYLTNPKVLVPKGKMAFAGLKDEAQRKDLIAFLAARK